MSCFILWLVAKKVFRKRNLKIPRSKEREKKTVQSAQQCRSSAALCCSASIMPTCALTPRLLCYSAVSALLEQYRQSSTTDREDSRDEKRSERWDIFYTFIYRIEYVVVVAPIPVYLYVYYNIHSICWSAAHNYTAITQKNPCALLYLHLRMDNTTDDAKCFLEVDGASPISNDSAPQAAKMESMPSR